MWSQLFLYPQAFSACGHSCVCNPRPLMHVATVVSVPAGLLCMWSQLCVAGPLGVAVIAEQETEAKAGVP